MKRELKRILLLLGVVISCFTMNVSVFAEDMDITISDEETDEDYSEDTAYSMLRGNNLNSGTTKIKKLASNKVNVYGLTQCHHSCSKVYLTLSLERKVNGEYVTYKSWDFTASNVTHLSKSINVIVPSGYYYRVRGYHAAKDGSKESVQTLTKGVLVK
nr:DUF6147 family protein [uncultured Blautia sp.]